ncbi:universal stress protein [Embleya sp. NBC_00896]|uniref:universal stress protein n=1 Tax=Embleya sp. NBC_00896 TaxID=2975961 RepID=UPI00387021EB
MHALDWPVGADHDPDTTKPWRTWSGIFHSAGQTALDRARMSVEGRHPDLELSETLVDGTPAKVVCDQARGAALVVLGSRRLSSIGELMTSGSIAVPVAAHAACPVVIVRNPEHATADPPTIVVGVDGSCVWSSAAAASTASRGCCWVP